MADIPNADSRLILATILQAGHDGIAMRPLVEKIRQRSALVDTDESADATRKKVERRLTTLLDQPDIPLTIIEGRPKRYCLPPHYQIPVELDAAMAMSVILAQQQLNSVFPEELLPRLKSYNDQATQVLRRNGSARYGRLIDRIAVHPEGYTTRLAPLTTPSQAAMDAILKSLADGSRLALKYQARNTTRNGPMVVNPLGLVVRGRIYYLVCTERDKQRVLHLNLARMFGSPTPLDEPAVAPQGFALDQYISNGGFEQNSQAPARRETIRLSVTQTIKELLLERKPGTRVLEDWPDDDEAIVEFEEVPHLEFQWWLLGLGDHIEVQAPPSLRQCIATIARNMAAYYQ